ncbi:hypothetical protein [Flagellimonas sp.]|uniref:hypothetical protein n=1 Tax=Flagellimonas sp. TaxID=2058762 RepID=UPI003B5BA67E
MKSNKILLVFLLTAQLLFAQVNDSITGDKNVFKEYYPIHIKPSIGYASNMTSLEDILFEARPVVNYSIHNNMMRVMQKYKRKPSNAVYFSFQPHLRMYSENSFPVKMPSYKILLGWQRLYKTPRHNFFAWAIESGHYSNGQSGCPFLVGEEAESEACEEFLRSVGPNADLTALLNRRNANFSTNTTKITLNYRFNNLYQRKGRKTELSIPYKVHSVILGWELFHNNLLGLIDIGGYTDFDINIYGRNRFTVGYEFIHTYKSRFRYAFKQELVLIDKAHNHVERLRSVTSFTLYPFRKAREIGFFINYIYGHDDYNYRLVDSGNQFGAGVNWDWFAPFEIRRVRKINKNIL